ncbi:hypothetical protein [Gemmata sp.]|uniref:hypothetical protein n=1 Tax=Gemmata sp. TaxID=1914242 RepID=UPI003F73051F
MLRTPRRDRRRGNILIVTLSLLALMAVVGLTAVYYTKDQAERARIQGQPKGGGEGFSADGTAPATHFLRTLVYDEHDYGTGLLNSARGVSLTATMYGRKPGANIAWNGPGTFGGSSAFVPDRRKLVNHRLFPGMTTVSHPEYDAEYGIATAYPATYGATQYAKNPPYTYPDIKDFYLASLCPATGEVVVPSFHREAAFGPLDPSNPNWTSGAGKYLTPRPRPQEHPNFPPVPRNQDGTVTGDVQNLPGGFFMTAANQPAIARNESIWIDTGLPAFTLPNGKRVKPLIAPLILDLDGRLNLNAHGNVMGGGTAHQSGQGFGPWEINLSKVLGTDAATVLAARGVVATRSGLTSRAFSPHMPAGNELPRSAQVAWTGFTGNPTLTLPAGAATDPTYSNGYLGTNAAVPNHPSVYNPYEWGATGATKAFPFTDTKILSMRYAPYRYDISQLSFASSANASLVGTAALPNPNPPHQTTPNPYRTDASHANRMLTTTVSNSLQRSMLMPGYTGTTPLASDPAAALGPIDLNRPLADYRGATATGALTPSTVNAANASTADNDRQQFAMDIFARLVAATITETTTEASVNPTTGVVTLGTAATPGSAPYTKLRQLAQLAANIVDYIDSDDVSTAFVWNPQIAGDPRNPTNFAAGELANRVVFGVEKPRLVINEAYSEVSNDPTDPGVTDATNKTQTADKPAHVRFWVELQNPSMQPYSAATAGPLGDGSAKVKYTPGELGMVPAFNPYQLVIVRNNKGGTPVINGLRVPTDANYQTNVTGDLPSGVDPDIRFDFSPASTATTQSIQPMNGMAGDGMVVLAANVPAAPTPPPAEWSDFTPGAGAFPNKIDGTAMPMAIGGSTTSLAYPIPLPMPATINNDLGTGAASVVGRHVLLLRRLANPYLPGPTQTNPYITVDVLDHVRSADRVILANGQNLNNVRMARAAVGGAGYEPKTPDTLLPHSVGKVQPLAAYSDPAQADSTTATATTAYPATTMVVQQNPAAPADGVKHTLGSQNSTLANPFDWFLHLDRPLVNQTELLHIATGRAHDATFNFVGAGGTKYGGAAQTVMLAATATPPYDRLYRAFDLLTVQPFGHQTALGGRMAGRININTIQDQRVWDSLFDAQNNGFDQTFVTNLWNQLMATRTVNMATRYDVAGNPHSCPIPGSTVHDAGTATGDRPFLPFGVATVAAGSGVTFNAGVGINDTLFRLNTATVPPLPPLPHLLVPPVTGHPYQQAEALRKILNNTTTVSHTFAVWITVGYFEVEGPETPTPVGGTFVTLGKEYYLNAPGDTRKKFFALVDRSNIGFKPDELTTAAPAPGAPYTQIDHPFFTTVEENAAAGTTIKIATSGTGTVYSDGTPVTLTAGMPLAIGVGANREIVTINAAPPAEVAGVTTITVAPALAKPHYAGESVSNIVPGNPGVPTDFDPTIAKYKAVVPLWVKLP